MEGLTNPQEKCVLLAGKIIKINAHVGYVVFVINYAPPTTWFANNIETKSKERIQRKVTPWILSNSTKSYQER